MTLTLCSAAALLRELKAYEASTSSAASVSSDSKISCIAWMEASLPDLWPAHTCVAPLASITSCFPILETHLPINLLITSPTPIGRTSPLPLSKGIRRFDGIGSMVSGSTYSVQSLFVSIAIESHKLVLDLLKDLQASILLKPTASTSEGPPEPLVLRAASLIISPLICWYAESGMSSTGANNSAQKLLSAPLGVSLLAVASHPRSAVKHLHFQPHLENVELSWFAPSSLA